MSEGSSAVCRCPNCRHTFRTMDDEVGMHDCPHCGYNGHEEDDDAEEDDEETEKT